MTDPNPQSILDSVKKVLGLAPDYTAFDLDVIMHINTVFLPLNQLGIGPSAGFVIEDNTLLWSNYSADMVLLAAVKSYVYLRVRMLFDPPATSFAIAAIENQIRELDVRLNMMAEQITPPSDPFTGQTPSGGTTEEAFWWDLTGGIDFPDEAAVGDLGIDTDNGNVYEKA